MQVFQRVFADIRRGLRRQPGLPPRLLIARDRDGDPRLDPGETALLHRVAATHGFVPTYFAEMDFAHQAALVFNADAVMGLHGAGLANILLGRQSLRILELNRIIGEEKLLRPWFRLLSDARRLRYDALQTKRGSLMADTLDRAVTRLCEGLPAP